MDLENRSTFIFVFSLYCINVYIKCCETVVVLLCSAADSAGDNLRYSEIIKLVMFCRRSLGN